MHLTQFRVSGVRGRADVLLVTLVDGSVVALDHATGRHLWTYDTGAPLASARQASAPTQGMNLVAGVDGGLYAYGAAQQNNPGLQVRRQPCVSTRDWLCCRPAAGSISPAFSNPGICAVGWHA